jgi:lipopolysaccharide export LptBFGC system permease protein LptF
MSLLYRLKRKTFKKSFPVFDFFKFLIVGIPELCSPNLLEANG